MLTELNEKEIFSVSGGVTNIVITSSIVMGAALAYGGNVIRSYYNNKNLSDCTNNPECLKKLTIEIAAEAMWGVQLVIPVVPIVLTICSIWRCFTAPKGRTLGRYDISS